MARDTATLGEDGILRAYNRQTHLREPLINLKDPGEEYRWRSWLSAHSTFRYESGTGLFTARKDRRKDSFFWYATRRIRGKQRTVYLGADEVVTLERLEKAAAELANRTDYQFEGKRWRELVGLFKQAGLELFEDDLGRWDWSWPSVMPREPFEPSIVTGDSGFASPEEAMIDAMSQLLFAKLALPRQEQEPETRR